MTYRFATKDDRPRFEEMLRAYLQEQEKLGHPVRFTRKTLDVYRDLAWAYLCGALGGFIVLAEEEEALQGFALCGEDWLPGRLDNTFGKLIQVWMIWVDPAYRKSGAALGMLTFGRPRALELGFETASMAVWEDNPEGQALCKAFGAKPAERILRFRLEEEPTHG